MADDTVAEALQGVFATDLFRVYRNPDVSAARSPAPSRT